MTFYRFHSINSLPSCHSSHPATDVARDVSSSSPDTIQYTEKIESGTAVPHIQNKSLDWEETHAISLVNWYSAF